MGLLSEPEGVLLKLEKTEFLCLKLSKMAVLDNSFLV